MGRNARPCRSTRLASNSIDVADGRADARSSRALVGGTILLTTGAVRGLLLVGAAWNGAGILGATILFSVALMVLGSVCTPLLRRLEIGECTPDPYEARFHEWLAAHPTAG